MRSADPGVSFLDKRFPESPRGTLRLPPRSAAALSRQTRPTARYRKAGYQLSHDVKHFTILFVTLCAPLAASAQSRADIAAVGGGGVVIGEDQRTSGVPGFGASLGFPYLGRQRLQFDYFFTRIGGELRVPGLNLPDADNRNQFITASYVVQSRTGRTRRFFQAGAGMFSDVSTRLPDIRTTHQWCTGIQWKRIRAWLSFWEAARRSM